MSGLEARPGQPGALEALDQGGSAGGQRRLKLGEPLGPLAAAALRAASRASASDALGLGLGVAARGLGGAIGLLVQSVRVPLRSSASISPTRALASRSDARSIPCSPAISSC